MIADTKFELGFIDGELAICDEILTPDSSRFWAASAWAPGTTPPSFDKQPVRDWAEIDRLGQGVGAPADPGGGRRRDADPLRGRLRTDHRTSARRLVRRRHVKFTAVVEITGREGIADPQGQTIERALPALGFEGVEHVRVGKVIRFVARGSRRDRRAGTGGVAVRPPAGQSRHRTGFDPLRSRPERLVRALEAGMSRRLAVVYFPGSNCEHDVAAVWTSLGGTAELVWHTATSLGDADAVVLPGGFAHGDYLRPGAIARFSPVMAAVARFAAEGGPVVGICNGFQVLTEAGLLPGALYRNAGLRFLCKTVECEVSSTDSVLTVRTQLGQVLRLPINHYEGNYTCDATTLRELEDEGRVVLRYRGDNPNGSVHAIAGITNRERQCRRSDATPRACERPDARFSRRAIAARVLARCFGNRPPIRGRVRP